MVIMWLFCCEAVLGIVMLRVLYRRREERGGCGMLEIMGLTRTRMLLWTSDKDEQHNFCYC
jgi:hypothetical protein